VVTVEEVEAAEAAEPEEDETDETEAVAEAVPVAVELEPQLTVADLTAATPPALQPLVY